MKNKFLKLILIGGLSIKSYGQFNENYKLHQLMKVNYMILILSTFLLCNCKKEESTTYNYLESGFKYILDISKAPHIDTLSVSAYNSNNKVQAFVKSNYFKVGDEVWTVKGDSVFQTILTSSSGSQGGHGSCVDNKIYKGKIITANNISGTFAISSGCTNSNYTLTIGYFTYKN